MGLVVLDPLEGPGAAAGASWTVAKATAMKVAATRTAQEIFFISMLFKIGIIVTGT